MIWLGTWCCYPSGCALCSSSENLSPGVKPGDNSFGSAQVTRKCDGQFIPHLGNAARSLNCSLAIRWCWCSRAAVSGLRVYKIYNGYWFFGRPTVEQLRLDLREALKRCRPDWDISSAAQRAAWDKGDKAGFHPYGKTQAEVLTEER
jgi:hypothetical protein